ncbi:hypothetical protein ACQY0O_008293 [Thecaphora frezii]
MTCSYQSLSPLSAFYSPLQSTSLSPPRGRASHAKSALFQRQIQLDDAFVDRLDRTDVLGGWSAERELIGHSGCINALSWSQSGELLASGSDDRNVVLWKLGTSQIHPTAEPEDRNTRRAHGPLGNWNADSDEGDGDMVASWPKRSYPSLEMGMMGKIQTGHRANIFSVKWAPHSSDRRLFTCAGDRQVRVFDINYSSAGPGSGQATQAADGKEYTLWNEGSGACIRVFRCHKDRAKRISTESSPDVFLTCSEDGDVRQMDLRTPHRCGPRTAYGEGCPSPLVHFPFGLYSLSVSKMEPWLFAVAGMSQYAYLQDRRMVPRLLKRDWGMDVVAGDAEGADAQALTMCVRRFGQPPGGFFQPRVEDDGKTFRHGERLDPRGYRDLGDDHGHGSDDDDDSDGENQEGDSDGDGEGDDDDDDDERFGGDYREEMHATACKINESTGRDLIVSYSSHYIFRFQIYDEPGVLHHNPEKRKLPGGRVVFRRKVDQNGSQDAKSASVPRIATLKGRCFQALFPLSAAVETKASAERVAAFWDDIKHLTEKLGPRRDRDGDPLETYAAVQVCRALGIIAFTESAELSGLLRRCIKEIRDQFAGYRVDWEVVPLLEKYEWTFGEEVEEGTEEEGEEGKEGKEGKEGEEWKEYERQDIQEELWLKAEILVEETWGEAVTTGKVIRSDGEPSDAAEDRQPKRPRTSEEVAEESGRTEGQKSRSSNQGHDGTEPVTEPGEEACMDVDPSNDDGGRPGNGPSDEVEEDHDGNGSDDDDDNDDNDNDDDDNDNDDDDNSVDALSSGEEMDLGEFDGYGFENDMSEGITDVFQLAPLVSPRNYYRGHANVETVKDVNFCGRDDRYVVSGSDDGNWFLWDTESTELKGLWKGDSSVVNVLQPHPSLPVVAISGIDDTIKLFGPVTLSPGRSVAKSTTSEEAEPAESQGADATAPRRLADRMAKREDIFNENQERIQGLRQRPSLSRQALLSMLQQHMMQRSLGERGAGRVVLRPLVGGGWAVTTAAERNEESERGAGDEDEEDEEAAAEDCVVM